VINKLYSIIFGRPNECDGRIPFITNSSVNSNTKSIKEVIKQK